MAGPPLAAAALGGAMKNRGSVVKPWKFERSKGLNILSFLCHETQTNRKEGIREL